MKFFKNIEISREFGVNPTTVTNWIQASIEGKNNLQLLEVEDRKFIIDNTNNRLIISLLTEKGRKHKSKDQLREVYVKKEFFEQFSQSQQSDIILALEIEKEIPHKYTYFNKGAEAWKKYTDYSFSEGIANTVTNTHEILNTNINYFLKIIENNKVNVVDIGVGDATPMREFIKHLFKLGFLNKYVAVDISPDMLHITENNLKNWFGEGFPAEFEVKDITKDSLQDSLFFNANYKSSVNHNLVFFVGSTIENHYNQDSILINIRDSLSLDDSFIVGYTLDNYNAKKYFDFSSTKDKIKTFEDKANEYDGWQDFIIPQQLGLTYNDFEVEVLFDEKENARLTQIVFNKDIRIIFDNNNFYKELFFEKGKRITTWRHNHHSLNQIISNLNDVGFEIKYVATSSDEAQVVLICKRSK